MNALEKTIHVTGIAIGFALGFFQPLLISGNMIENDDAQRFTETESKNGSIGLIEGAQVVETAIKIIKLQKQ